MRDKFKKLPEALQKQVIMRLGAAALSLLLTVVVIALYRDLYLSLAFVLFSLFFGISGTVLFIRATDGKYIEIEGQCTKVERTPIRKRPKTIYLEADPHTVKLQVRDRLKKVSVGDTAIVYVSESTPVYQEEGCQILSGYLAMEIRKGSE